MRQKNKKCSKYATKLVDDYIESSGSARTIFGYIAELEGLCRKASDYIKSAADLIIEEGGDEEDDADARAFAKELRSATRRRA